MVWCCNQLVDFSYEIDDGSTSFPLFVAVMSAISLVLDEKEYMVNVQSATEIIPSCLVLHHSKQQSAGAG